MAKRDRPHIVIPRQPEVIAYTERGGGRGGDYQSPFAASDDRRKHVDRLSKQLQDAVPAEEDGIRLEFRSYPGLTLELEKMESLRRGAQPRLDSVRIEETETGSVETAVVFVPQGKIAHFNQHLDKYRGTVENDLPRRAQFVESIQEIRRATVRSLWTDPPYLFPEEPGRHWWEVWLYHRNGEAHARLVEEERSGRIRLSSQYLGFGRHAVTLIQASIDELGHAISILDDISEIRLPHDSANLIVELKPWEQQDWVSDLSSRITFSDHADETAICILDEHVDASHSLLSGALREQDLHVARPGLVDVDGGAHATKMAGIALFGDLGAVIKSTLPITLGHVLESVKILSSPDSTEEDKVLFASLMVDATSRVEIQEPNRRRIFFSAVTANPDRPSAFGEQPTSWSAAVDALAYGHSIELSDEGLAFLTLDDEPHRRLFVQSVGNIETWHLQGRQSVRDRNDLESILDPAQAWNAISVGAFTEMDTIETSQLGGDELSPLVGRGTLAPSSRTGVSLGRKWPRKPEVVAEGGNYVGTADLSQVLSDESLSVLTTGLSTEGRAPFSFANGTSPSAAKVAQHAAEVWAAYPSLWPETIRGLVVHSAEWTDQMRKEIERDGDNRRAYQLAARRYGMGVPSLERAMRSASDALTLVAESTIQPFDYPSGGDERNSGRTNEMNLHALPWPSVDLLALGSFSVSMRVTLSYFVEPNPMRKGWTGRYQYPSHMLRFHVRNQNETTDQFKARLNKRGQDGDYQGGVSDSEGWLIGTSGQRASGSIVSDIWRGTAAELAQRGVLAIVPVKGWWAEQLRSVGLKQVRYSLIVSIEAPEVEVDLWAAVNTQITTTVEIPH